MAKTIKNACFLVFSDDFGEHPSSCQHLFRHISQQNSILWVNTIGMRSPRLTKRDLIKTLIKIRKMALSFFGKEKKIPNITNIKVCQPPMIPFLNIPFIRAINRRSVAHHVKRQLDALNFKNPILVITAPNACDYIGLFSEKRVVYYCVDDFSQWPGLEKNLVKEMETELIIKSDIHIATSQLLLEKIERFGKHAKLLTHGVDIDFFSNTQTGEHKLLANIPKPRVGYFGLFDDRSDQELITKIATALPNVSFVITGDIETDTSQIAKLPNIYFTGSIPYSELPAMAMGYDICMLPYKINELTNAIQPLKIKEYLATGKPVISTAIKEAEKLVPLICASNSPEEWLEFIQARLENPTSLDLKERKTLIKNESWEKKSEQFLEYITD